MNTPREPGFDERRWQAQERARLAVRGGHGDADAHELRIARALRQPPRIDLAADFAAQVAALARTQAAADVHLEQRLLRGLGIALGLSTAACVAWFGRDWVAALSTALPGGADAAGWSVAVALCLLGNWGWGAVKRLREGDAPIRARARPSAP